MEALDEISTIAVSVGVKFFQEYKPTPEHASPLLLGWLYRSAAIMLILQQNHHRDDWSASEEILRNTLEALGCRWTVASLQNPVNTIIPIPDLFLGIYLQLLEARKLAGVPLGISL